MNLKMWESLLVILLSLLIAQTRAQISPLNSCGGKSTCGECIQMESCAWCMSNDYGDQPRCFQPSLLSKQQNCPDKDTWNPSNYLIITANQALTRKGQGTSQQGKITQFAPQKLSLKLRVKQMQRIKVSYSQAKDYPVDLYYLMDLSQSMSDDKDNLSKLGNKLAEAMRNITSNFRLGFGSFIDKVILPFTRPTQRFNYGFRNHMSLSENADAFAKKVREAKIFGNIDTPEGGFDGLMQAVVCHKEIGWRPQARHLIVYSSDASFHVAGDGKLAGIITPNDGQCHLNNNDYTHSLLQDYPSIAHINRKVKQNAVNVIFAVTNDTFNIYKKLSERLEGSSVGRLAKDSENVVDLVNDEYQKISSSVEVRDNATSDVKIHYFSKCRNNKELVSTNKCGGLKVGNAVEFEVEIEVLQCPNNPTQRNQVIQIYPVGINESLIIDLEMICDCPCEKPGHKMYELNSSKCHHFGTYKCGTCECNPGYFGKSCECAKLDLHNQNVSTVACRPDNVTQVECSGRGSCLCGVCECNRRSNADEVVSGPYCECDNFSCMRHNNQLCSGPDHGTCKCGSCVCSPNWSGPDCSCTTSNEMCLAPNTNEICSGNGECVCGECRCKKTEDGQFSGRFCEKCPTCPGRCQEFKSCVQCHMYKTGNLKSEEMCRSNCTAFVMHPVDNVVADAEKDEQMCAFTDENDCQFAFVYNDREEPIVIKAQQNLDCPPPVSLIVPILSVIVFVVFVGLATLVAWKVLTTIHDRKEFARFEEERANAQWNTGENPLYKTVTTTVQNPTFNE